MMDCNELLIIILHDMINLIIETAKNWFLCQ